MPLQLTLEVERETDGRFLAEVLELPGVLAYDDTREGAIVSAEALALRTLAARLEAGESVLHLAEVFRVVEANADTSERETAYLLRSEAMKKRLLDAIARDEDRHSELNKETIQRMNRTKSRFIAGTIALFILFVWMAFNFGAPFPEFLFYGSSAVVGMFVIFFILVGSNTIVVGMIWTACQIARYIFWSGVVFVIRKRESEKRAR